MATVLKFASFILLLLLLNGAESSPSNLQHHVSLARCLAGCAAKYTPDRTVERTLLSGEKVLERNESDTDFQLCSLGCEMPVFGAPFAGIHIGKDLYRTAKELAIKDLPPVINSIDAVCIEAQDESTTLLLGLDLTDKDINEPFICSIDVWAESLSLSGPVLVDRGYTLKTRFSLKYKFDAHHSYQFRAACYSFDGKLGQEVGSEWYRDDQLSADRAPLNIILEHQEKVNGQVSITLGWSKTISSLPWCKQKIYLTSNDTVDWEVSLDESKKIALNNLNFGTTYLVKSSPVTSSDNDVHGMKFTTKTCQAFSNSSYCSPLGVEALYHFIDIASDRIIIAWQYPALENVEEMAFFIVVRTADLVIHQELVKGSERTAVVNLNGRRGEYEVEVVAVDSKNRRSPPNVTKFHHPGSNRKDWILTALSLIVCLIILIILILSFTLARKLRNGEAQTEHSLESGSHIHQQPSPPAIYFSTPLNGGHRNTLPKSCFRNENREAISEIASISSISEPMKTSASMDIDERYFIFPIVSTPSISENGFKTSYLPDGEKITVPRIGTYL
uniref:Protein kinase domain-containing protein n=1 Tax=Steinernema glaseri TaxID=37863 RepID=A0A1I7ZB97_9BILA